MHSSDTIETIYLHFFSTSRIYATRRDTKVWFAEKIQFSNTKRYQETCIEKRVPFMMLFRLFFFCIEIALDRYNKVSVRICLHCRHPYINICVHISTVYNIQRIYVSIQFEFLKSAYWRIGLDGDKPYSSIRKIKQKRMSWIDSYGAHWFHIHNHIYNHISPPYKPYRKIIFPPLPNTMGKSILTIYTCFFFFSR